MSKPFSILCGILMLGGMVSAQSNGADDPLNALATFLSNSINLILTIPNSLKFVVGVALLLWFFFGSKVLRWICLILGIYLVLAGVGIV